LDYQRKRARGEKRDVRSRATSRIILLDERERVLLFKFADPNEFVSGGPRLFWGTPGGGVNARETHEAAARRELWEETGINDATIGPWIWTEDHELILGGKRTRLRERFYLVRMQSPQIAMFNIPTAEERSAIREHKWWSVEEIASSSETFFPPGLPELIAPIVAGRIPSEPVLIASRRKSNTG
jgi:8-oxo-dGTP pyrophosphatase MutT (NUDIX family)